MVSRFRNNRVRGRQARVGGAARLLLGACWMLAMWFVPGLSANDQIYAERGIPLNGTITKMTANEVTMQVVNMGERVIPVNTIRRLSFSEDAPNITRARDLIENGRYQDALTDLKATPDGDWKKRAELKADVDFYNAYCLARLALTTGGDKAAAASAMLAFVNANPNNYHFFEACEIVGDLAMALGNFPAAEDNYGKLSAAAWPEMKVRSALLTAHAQRGKGDVDKALANYTKVSQATLSTPEIDRLKLFGSIGAAACQAESGQTAAGVTTLQQIILKNDPKDVELFARAYNALGDCHRKANRPKEALLAYLHTDILFYAATEPHAEALYHLSLLWDQEKRSDRAIAARDALKNRYAGSFWRAKLGP